MTVLSPASGIRSLENRLQVPSQALSLLWPAPLLVPEPPKGLQPTVGTAGVSEVATLHPPLVAAPPKGVQQTVGTAGVAEVATQSSPLAILQGSQYHPEPASDPKPPTFAPQDVGEGAVAVSLEHVGGASVVGFSEACQGFP